MTDHGGATDVETVLVPVDGSDEATPAVDYGLAVADRYGAALHAVFVVGQSVGRAVATGTVDEEVVAEEADGTLREVRERAEASDVPVDTTTARGFSRTVKRQHPGSVVLDVAADEDADFLVVPREDAPDGERGALGKAAEYVLQYASQPVLSV